VSDDSPAELAELPEITPGPEGGGPEYDPVIALTDLIRGNSQVMNEMTQSGVELKDAHSMITTMITQEFLESILRAVAGEGAVVAAAIRVHERIAETLATAKSQVTRQQLAAGVSPSALLNGNRAQRRGRG
jgi:hypothetical protein